MHLFLETTAAAGGGMGSMLIMMLAVLAIMYFLMIRPENKKKKEAEQMRSAVKVGDKITTIGGIVGVVCSVKDDKIVIETGFGWSLPNGRFLPTTRPTRPPRLPQRRLLQPENGPRKKRKLPKAKELENGRSRCFSWRKHRLLL